MLHKPILAKCDDRNDRARTHPNGEPDKWIVDTHLASHGLVGLTFDFFVNWNAGSIPNQLWIKRIVDNSLTSWPTRDSARVIYQCDGEEKVIQLCRFADRYGMSCHYFLFKESTDSQHPPDPIIEVTFDGSGSVVGVQKVELSTLRDRIRQLRGGQASVGPKGLTYGLTSLECFLSKTPDIWPGDADLVLVDANLTPVAIMEFKKDTHRRRVPYADQKFSNNYPKPDGRKYNSFAYFRDHFTDDPSSLPIIVLYYSIETDYDYVKLERVEGAAGSLRAATEPVRYPLPNANDEQSCRDFTASLLEMINYKT